MAAGEPNAGSGMPSTHWTKVYLAADHGREAGSRALAELLTAYRPALQQYLSHRFSQPPEELKDWVSAFIEKKVMERHLLAEAHESKGRFRNFLLTALYRFAEEQRRHGERQRRKPPGGFVAFEDGHNEVAAPSGNSHPNPGDRRWAQEVIERARQRTEEFYRRKGCETTWLVFHEGCYLPLYQCAERPSDVELAQRHGLESDRQASNKIETAKRQFGNFLRQVVRQYEMSEGAVDDEIRELIALVSDGAGA